MTPAPIAPAAARAERLRAMTPLELRNEIADRRVWLAIVTKLTREDAETLTRARLVARAMQSLSEARVEAYRRTLEVWS